ncbi:MAG: serine dehydratase subunit alpha family protein [Lawsonibacter sp.]|jgi:L-cysteine desulfidase
MDKETYFISAIQNAIKPSTGCTEPVAIALCGAMARREAVGEIQHVEVVMDIGLFKNAIGVGIPGLTGRGIPLCCALGIVDGNPDNGMDILGKIKCHHLEEIQRIAGLVTPVVREDMPDLFIQTTITTDQDCVRAITYKSHDNIQSVQHAPFVESQKSGEVVETVPEIQQYTLSDMLNFASGVPREKIQFLWTGVEMNRKVSQAGEKLGYLAGIAELNDGSLLTTVQRRVGAASYARMSGINLPTMTATGSGNQGITLFLTVDALCQYKKIEQEQELRALALANLVNLYAKSYTGSLAPVCACGVASGLGASVGIVYALGGGEREMLGAMKNILGGVTGMLCDGAKEGCANKTALAASCSVTSALAAMGGQTLSEKNGILAPCMQGLFQHLQYLLKQGMAGTNRAMVDIMLEST